MSWFFDHMMTERDARQEGDPVTKLERWYSREQHKREHLRKERSKLELKFQNYLIICDTIRLELQENLRELQQSECYSQVALMLLFSHGKAVILLSVTILSVFNDKPGTKLQWDRQVRCRQDFLAHLDGTTQS